MYSPIQIIKKYKSSYGTPLEDYFVLEILPKVHRFQFSSEFYESSFFNSVVFNGLLPISRSITMGILLKFENKQFRVISDVIPFKTSNLVKKSIQVGEIQLISDYTSIPIFHNVYSGEICPIFRNSAFIIGKNVLSLESSFEHVYDHHIIENMNSNVTINNIYLSDMQSNGPIYKLKNQQPDQFELPIESLVTRFNKFLDPKDKFINGFQSKAGDIFIEYPKKFNDLTFSPLIDRNKKSYTYTDIDLFVTNMIELNRTNDKKISSLEKMIPLSKLKFNILMNKTKIGEHAIISTKNSLGHLKFSYDELFYIVANNIDHFSLNGLYKFKEFVCAGVQYYKDKRPEVHCDVLIERV